MKLEATSEELENASSQLSALEEQERKLAELIRKKEQERKAAMPSSNARPPEIDNSRNRGGTGDSVRFSLSLSTCHITTNFIY
jgi:hypothetical protein